MFTLHQMIHRNTNRLKNFNNSHTNTVYIWITELLFIAFGNPKKGLVVLKNY